MNNARIAKIKNTKLGKDEKGRMFLGLNLEFDSYECLYGCSLSGDNNKTKYRSASQKIGIEIIGKILNVVGVNNWEDLKGKYVIVEKGKIGDDLNVIWNILEDKCINIKDFFEKDEK